MPVYDYHCDSCGDTKEVIHRMLETPVVSCSCGEKMKKVFSLNVGGFIIKGGTPTSHWKEKRLRMKKSEELAVKQQARKGSLPNVKPNIAGYETSTWSDAQKLAKEAGMNHESYQPFVDKEKKSKITVASAGVKV